MFPIILISILLVFSGGFLKNLKKDVPTLEPTVKEEIVEPSVSPNSTTKPQVEGAKIEVKVETNSTPSPTIKSYGNIDNFKYPNSKIISSSDNSLVLESSEDSSKITDWYKQKISEKDMNVKTFVTTSSNDKIENKLVAANDSSKIQIEIIGTEGGPLTIKVNLTSN